MKTLNATDFKARCLHLLDEVVRTGEGLTVTKRGKPVAVLVPAVACGNDEGYPQQCLKGAFEILGDVVSPTLAPEAWEASLGEWEP